MIRRFSVVLGVDTHSHIKLIGLDLSRSTFSRFVIYVIHIIQMLMVRDPKHCFKLVVTVIHITII